MSKPVSADIFKPTVNDIARHAGVSLATVDRVLNARPGVRRVTIERVNKAIDELGYIRDTAAANLARRRIYHFVFLLPDIKSEFIDALQAQINTQAMALSADRAVLRVQRVTAFDSRAIVMALDDMNPQETNGIALIGPETPAIRDAIGRTRARGIVVVALLSDLPSSGRDHFIGVDNALAGQTAGKLMGRFIHAEKGRILVLTHARLARDHLERRQGFDRVIATQFPQFRVLPSIEARDDKMLVEQVMPELLNTWDDVRGIYATTSADHGLVEFLVKQPPEMVVIAHELTPLSRKALESGVFDALICQDTGHIVRSAVRLMRATIDSAPYNATQERIRIEIFLSENLPPAN